MVDNLTNKPIMLEDEFVGSTVLIPVLVAVLSLTVIVIVVMFCAKCREKQTTDVQLTEVSTVPEKKKAPQENGVIGKPVSPDDVHVQHRSSNGVQDNRPKSHDRALPELPINGMEYGDDEMEPGHYDIIGRKRQKDMMNNMNAYDKIQGEADTDSGGYAGIAPPPPPQFASSSLSTAGNTVASGAAGITDPSTCNTQQQQHSYAYVADVEYAQIPDRGNRRNGNNSSKQTNSSFIHDTSVDTIDAPEIPDRNYNEDSNTIAMIDADNESVVDSMLMSSQQATHQSSSPLLPPRNSMAVGAEAMLVTEDGAAGIMNGGQASGPNDAIEIVKGPDYTKVTARESLNHMRLRHQEEMALRGGHVDYDTVDYDHMKSVSGASGAPERSSLTSDLYAEIASSTRSSTYARVGDVSAPLPPSIDSLSRITHTDDFDMVDPGYSQIKKRPASTVSNSSSSGRRSPLYAVVDKSRKRPQTIAGPLGITEPTDNHDITTDNNFPVYSQVQKKPKNQTPLLPQQSSSATPMLLPGASVAIGAASASVPMVTTDYDPDYDQVQDVPITSTTERSETIQSDDYDPNYAQLKETVSEIQPVVRSEPIYQEISEGTML